MCCVAAALHIGRSNQRLTVNLATPVAVFVDTKQLISQYIINVHITQLLQVAATRVHNITCKINLARFTAHSLRVGVSILLHSQGTTTDLIKLRLCWRSDAFMPYLRNIDVLVENIMIFFAKFKSLSFINFILIHSFWLCYLITKFVLENVNIHSFLFAHNAYGFFRGIICPQLTHMWSSHYNCRHYTTHKVVFPYWIVLPTS